MPHYNHQKSLNAMNIKRKKAEDLLAGLLAFRTDLGCEGEKLIHLLLDAGIKATRSENFQHKNIYNSLH